MLIVFVASAVTLRLATLALCAIPLVIRIRQEDAAMKERFRAY